MHEDHHQDLKNILGEMGRCEIQTQPQNLLLFREKHKVAVHTVSFLTDENGTLQDNARAMSEWLQKQYCSVFSNLDMANLDCISDVNPQYAIWDTCV